MNRIWLRTAALMGLGLAACAGTAMGQNLSASFPTPAIDRWMYSFNQTPGTETEARVFSPLFSPYQSSFDNRDGQFLIAWDTAGQVAPGQPANHYRIVSATVTARVSGDQRFTYDPTYDAFNTYLPTDPAYTPDMDAGRPLEMFVCGYRNGYTAQTFAQTSAYAPGAPFPFPARSIRNVFPAQYDSTGALIDISNNVEDRIEARPIGVARAQSNTDMASTAPVMPGQLAPLNTDMVFDIDLSKREAVDALRAGLASGRVEFLITSLTLTDQQASTVPRFYTRQWTVQNGPDPAAHPASLSLTVCVGRPADWDCSGTVSVQDLFSFLADWFAGHADFNASGATTVQDIFDFLAAWFAG